MDAVPAKHILIVEDSQDLQFLLSQLFMVEGYIITKAFNGRQALDLLSTMVQLPSVILLDIMMPVMDGVEFRELQVKDPRLASIPVVVMTADSNFHAKAKQMAVADFIRKPIANINAFVQAVERLSSKPPVK